MYRTTVFVRLPMILRCQVLSYVIVVELQVTRDQLHRSGGAAGDKRSAPSDGGGFAFGGGGGAPKEPKAAAAPFAGGSFGFGGASAPALEFSTCSKWNWSETLLII